MEKKLLKAHLSDRCDKIRQMLRPLLPNGFIPHPMKVRLNEDTGTFSIAQDASSDCRVPFLSLATRALYHGMAEMPFDTWKRRPKVTTGVVFGIEIKISQELRGLQMRLKVR